MFKIYDFKCLKCSCIFESMVKGEDGLPDKCPECNSTSFEKQLSTASFRCSGGYNSAYQPKKR